MDKNQDEYIVTNIEPTLISELKNGESFWEKICGSTDVQGNILNSIGHWTEREWKFYTRQNKALVILISFVFGCGVILAIAGAIIADPTMIWGGGTISLTTSFPAAFLNAENQVYKRLRTILQLKNTQNDDSGKNMSGRV